MANKLPIGFVGHGSPMNITSDNAYTRSISNLDQKLPKPEAILVVTAHWMSDGVTAVTTGGKPELIYDFYGFPKELYEIQYNCPGYPAIEKLLQGLHIVPAKEYGLDHGVWAILKFMYPKADIPVVALSLDMSQPAEYHYNLGKSMKFLRENGVLVLGSGNIVHNLFKADLRGDSEPYDWAIDFENEVVGYLNKKDFSELVHYGDQKTLSIPTRDHYLPLLYILGMVDDEDTLEILYQGIQNKSVSQLSFLFK